ncbi:MAG TPA: TonB-dependent receptor [Rhodanobacter sp.]
MMSHSLKREVLAGAVCLGLAVSTAYAQSREGQVEVPESSDSVERGPPAEQPAATELEAIRVTGSRFSDSIDTYPGAFTVVSTEELDRQLAVTNDLASVLAFSVPGMAASSNTADNVVQGLRGRPVRVFIDGIPVSNPLRDGGRDFRLISPHAIESIEVIRGSSAVYGQGGSGGIINYITRTGAAKEQWGFRSELGVGFSATHVGDSFNPTLFQSAAGMLGGFDVMLEGTLERTQGQFDANGKRLAPDPHGFGGIADSEINNFFGKVGYSFGNQRFELMANTYRQEQDTDYIAVKGSIAKGIPLSAIKGQYHPNAKNQENRNRVYSLSYYHFDVFGSTLTSKLYKLDNFAMFSYEPARLGGSQSLIESSKKGWQTDLRTPLTGLGIFSRGEILWGVDISRDVTAQPLLPQTYIPGDGRTFTPPLQQKGYAGFAQLKLPMNDWFTLNAGMRHDNFTLDIDPFVAGLTNVAVEGGRLKYSATPYNLGADIHINDKVSLFGGFSQGFSIPDIGVPMRRLTVSSLAGFKPKPQIVDNYELGLRGTVGGVTYETSYYMNKAGYGTDFVIDPKNPTEATTLREKEKIRGWELALSGRLGEATRWGLNYATSEGRRDANGDGKVDTYLSNRRVGPSQLNAMLEQQINSNWFVRVQANRSGSRNRFPTAPINNFYSGRIRPTNRIDLSTQYTINNFDMSFGISNLFNNDYYSVASQLINRDERYSKAEGRRFFMKVGINY